MKKTLIFILLVLFTTVFISADNFRFTLYGNYFSVADKDYKKEYGGKKYFPEAKLSLRIRGNIYIWGSFGYLPASYTLDDWSNKGAVDPDVVVKHSSDKMFFGGGLGYWVGYFAPHDFSIKFEIGACGTYNTIKMAATKTTTDEVLRTDKSSEIGIGITTNLGVTYGLLKNVYSELSLGYMYVWDQRTAKVINAGGFRLSIGLGMKF
jgi:hypothetical protein